MDDLDQLKRIVAYIRQAREGLQQDLAEMEASDAKTVPRDYSPLPEPYEADK